ncbi:DUF1223 domain-containing protein [Rhizobium setariae]|uniref:DUF1223 domain-containing protein n=1 Tax=Rhizobium setariae TaxID=2801340 RepID=UPI001FEE6BDF|nr:DUF1223 domain-containing protein [Rhizobium setariae]
MAVIFCASVNAGEIARSHPIGVVELFTSQGCSSCPKADAAIAELADHPDIVTITYHVDYWNYLGWSDTLATTENTDRQYAYAKTLGNSNVYTPQIVLNGLQDMRGAPPIEIRAGLEKFVGKGQGVTVPIKASLSPDELTISIGAGSGKADVVIAYFKKATVVDIQRGENTGKRVTYRNAVTKLETVGMWDGKPLTIKLPAAMIGKRGQEGCAILLQSHDKDGNPGRIYGASAL